MRVRGGFEACQPNSLEKYETLSRIETDAAVLGDSEGDASIIDVFEGSLELEYRQPGGDVVGLKIWSSVVAVEIDDGAIGLAPSPTVIDGAGSEARFDRNDDGVVELDSVETIGGVIVHRIGVEDRLDIGVVRDETSDVSVIARAGVLLDGIAKASSRDGEVLDRERRFRRWPSDRRDNPRERLPYRSRRRREASVGSYHPGRRGESSVFYRFKQPEDETGRLNAYGSDTDFFTQGLSISRARDLI